MPLVVDDQELGTMRRPWQFGVAVGRAYELLRTDVQAHVRLCRERIGFRYCRFHGLFHDDMLVAVRDAQGKPHFQWSQVDKVFDFLLSIGMKPFVELGPMPAALASGPETFFWWRMNVTPPRDFGEWEALVESFTRHCVRRYGLEEVRSWYFEVWNEPNLRAFWNGTWEQYIELYARAGAAVKRVDPQLRVGGPASAEAKKVPEFLADCAARNLPVDFVSTHVYPQNEWNHYEDDSPHRPGEFFGDTIRRVRQEVPEGIPVFWTEYSSLTARTRADVEWVDNPSIDRLESAAFLVRQAFELDSTNDGMVWWVASDVFEEAGIAQSPFSCTYGLVTIDGIPKASFRAFEMLAKLKGHRISPSFVEDPGSIGKGGGRGVDDADANFSKESSPTPTPPSREGLSHSPSFEGGGRGVDVAYANFSKESSPTPTPPSREGLSDSPSFEGGGRGVDDADPKNNESPIRNPQSEIRNGLGVASFQDGDTIRLLAWNDASVASPETWRERVGVPFIGEALRTQWRIRKGQGSAYETWTEAGRPQEMTPFQIETLQTASIPEATFQKIEPQDGTVWLEIELEPGEAALFEIAPKMEPAHNRDHYTAEVSAWNQALGEKGK